MRSVWQQISAYALQIQITRDLADTDDGAAADWACLCLGVPLTRPSTHQWEVCWYSDRPSARKRDARLLRKGILRGTANLLTTALERLQQAAYHLHVPGVDLPDREVRRRADIARQYQLRQDQRQVNMLRSYFKPVGGQSDCGSGH